MYTCSREVLRELFQLPKNVYYNRSFSNYRSFSCRLSRSGWASVLDLFQRTFQPSRAKHKNSSHSNPPHSNATGWALGLPTSSNALSNPHEPASPKLQPSQPPAPPNALGLTCTPPSSGRSQPQSSHPPPASLRSAADLPRPSADGSRRLRSATLRYAPLRSATLRYDELFSTSV